MDKKLYLDILIEWLCKLDDDQCVDYSIRYLEIYHQNINNSALNDYNPYVLLLLLFLLLYIVCGNINICIY